MKVKIALFYFLLANTVDIRIVKINVAFIHIITTLRLYFYIIYIYTGQVQNLQRDCVKYLNIPTYISFIIKKYMFKSRQNGSGVLMSVGTEAINKIQEYKRKSTKNSKTKISYRKYSAYLNRKKKSIQKRTPMYLHCTMYNVRNTLYRYVYEDYSCAMYIVLLPSHHHQNYIQERGVLYFFVAIQRYSMYRL